MKFHEIAKVSFSGNTMTLHVDARRLQVDLDRISPRLARASAQQRMRYEISPSGYGISWPELDEDLSVDRLLGIRHAPEAKPSRHVAEDQGP